MDFINSTFDVKYVVNRNQGFTQTVYVRSYYTAIALQCIYIDFFLLQVGAASPHFKLKWI